MDIKDFFEKHSNVIVAVSGGVDSAVLLHFASLYADRVKVCFVNNGFQPSFAFTDAKKICDKYSIPINHIVISALSDNNIADNNEKRCYYCKKQMFSAVKELAVKEGAEIVEGTNFDDDVDGRPGFRAITELGVLSPLRMCRLSKGRIREIARENGISVYDKPSYSCLATRIKNGNKITDALIQKTEKAENILYNLGYSNFRIRYDNGAGELELTATDRNKYNSDKRGVDALLSEYYNIIILSECVRDE